MFSGFVKELLNSLYILAIALIAFLFGFFYANNIVLFGYNPCKINKEINNSQQIQPKETESATTVINENAPSFNKEEDKSTLDKEIKSEDIKDKSTSIVKNEDALKLDKSVNEKIENSPKVITNQVDITVDKNNPNNVKVEIKKQSEKDTINVINENKDNQTKINSPLEEINKNYNTKKKEVNKNKSLKRAIKLPKKDK